MSKYNPTLTSKEVRKAREYFKVEVPDEALEDFAYELVFTNEDGGEFL